MDLTKMLAEAQIPVERLPKMLPFLAKHCVDGHYIGHPTTIKKVWLPKVFQQHVASLRAELQGKKRFG